MVIIVTGISGSGRAVVGRALAEELGCHFYNGDDLHPQENLDKIEQGLPLSEEDRAPWLRSLNGLIEDHVKRGRQAVISCHYLNKVRRDQIPNDSKSIYFVYLQGDFQTLLDRIRGRKNFAAERLKKEYALLDETEHHLVVEIEDDPKVVVSNILSQLKLAQESSE